jgi:hypothetical protein
MLVLGRVLTWCMISLSTSTGRSSSLIGIVLAFSFPLGGLLIVSLDEGGAPATAASKPLLRRHSRSSRGDAILAASGVGNIGWRSSSSEGAGEHVLGVPGDEGGEDSMLYRDDHVSPGRGDMNAHRVPTKEACDSAASGLLVVESVCGETCREGAALLNGNRARPPLLPNNAGNPGSRSTPLHIE